MGNPYRGEVSLTIDGRVHDLKLTLGALAELEETLQAESLLSLIERFENGKFKTKDLIGLTVAGLKGGGWQGCDADLMAAKIEGGPVAVAQVAARLLKLSFMLPGDTV